METSQKDKAQRDDLLVHGWVREEDKMLSLNIPAEIMRLCLIWYHFELYIINGPQTMKTNEDESIIAVDHEFHTGSCYGSIRMPSIDNTFIYEYTIKILSHRNGVAIGMDEAKCQWPNTWFIGNTTKNYGFQFWNAKAVSFKDPLGTVWGKRIKGKCLVKMKYNAYKSTLSYKFDGEDRGVAFRDVVREKGLEYRLCIYLNAQSCLELIDFKKESAV